MGTEIELKYTVGNGWRTQVADNTNINRIVQGYLTVNGGTSAHVRVEYLTNPVARSPHAASYHPRSHENGQEVHLRRKATLEIVFDNGKGLERLQLLIPPDEIHEFGVDPMIGGEVHIPAGFEARVRLTSNRDTRVMRGLVFLKGPKAGDGSMRFVAGAQLQVSDVMSIFERRAYVGGLIIKDRHDIPLADGLKVEVDVHYRADDIFRLHPYPRVIAEIELPDRYTSVPEVFWLGRNVTGDSRYTNASLALDPSVLDTPIRGHDIRASSSSRVSSRV